MLKVCREPEKVADIWSKTIYAEKSMDARYQAIINGESGMRNTSPAS
jgi:hypothetical protein